MPVFFSLKTEVAEIFSCKQFYSLLNLLNKNVEN